MKAVMVREWGGSDAALMEEVERPEPAADELRVKVKATSISPFDWKIRLGYLADYVALPFRLGSDFAGVVDAVGADIEGWTVGTPVFSFRGLAGGAFAEYLTVKPGEIALMPKSLSFAEAAAVPHAAMTAWYMLIDAANVQAGQRVLIHAAAGGVGHYAVQFAKWRGAYVIGTASSRHESFLKEMGVDEIVDYTAVSFESVIDDVDVVLDTIGFDTTGRSLQKIKSGGTIVCVVTPPDFEAAAQRGVRAHYIGGQPNGEILTTIANLIDSGKVKPYIQQTFPFAQIHDALALSEGLHVQGKLAVTIAD
jgi:NADPH:quinone reductase-like Zn-dependent oxidoreductase